MNFYTVLQKFCTYFLRTSQKIWPKCQCTQKLGNIRIASKISLFTENVVKISERLAQFDYIFAKMHFDILSLI